MCYEDSVKIDLNWMVINCLFVSLSSIQEKCVHQRKGHSWKKMSLPRIVSTAQTLISS